MKEKHLLKQLNKTTKQTFTNKTSKTILSSGGNAVFSVETQKKIDEVKINVSEIVKKTNCNPQELLDYVKATNTPVYKFDNADKLLNLIHEEEGLIYAHNGISALYLSLITGQGLKFETAPMFILRDGILDKYLMLHNFYRWFSLKSDLPGFEPEIQKKFRDFLIDNSEDAMKRFSMEDIISLKEAIARDQEATEFVLEYSKQVDGAKNVLNKMKNEGGAQV